MKTCFIFLALSLATASASEVKKFNDALIKGVQKDLETDNVDSFKKPTPSRAPASVEANHPGDMPKDEQKFNKMNQKQLGNSSW